MKTSPLLGRFAANPHKIWRVIKDDLQQPQRRIMATERRTRILVDVKEEAAREEFGQR